VSVSMVGHQELLSQRDGGKREVMCSHRESAFEASHKVGGGDKHHWASRQGVTPSDRLGTGGDIKARGKVRDPDRLRKSMEKPMGRRGGKIELVDDSEVRNEQADYWGL